MQQIYIGNTLVNDVYLGNKRLYDVLQNYVVVAGYDPDAQAFINATGISGADATAINNLVLALKANSLWTPMLAIYPMIGGTQTTCKYNLKNPLDTDAAFRLSFNGGWTFSSAGATPDGVGGTYADTFLVPNTHMSATDGHISYYSTTDSNLGDEMVEIGADTGGDEINLAASYGNTFYAFYAGAGGGGTNNSTSQGYYINNRGTNTEGWRNGTKIIDTGAGSAVTTRPLYLGSQNNGDGFYRNSNRNCAFASIGLTISSPSTLSTIVNDYQTELGRNVY